MPIQVSRPSLRPWPQRDQALPDRLGRAQRDRVRDRGQLHARHPGREVRREEHAGQHAAEQRPAARSGEQAAELGPAPDAPRPAPAPPPRCRCARTRSPAPARPRTRSAAPTRRRPGPRRRWRRSWRRCSGRRRHDRQSWHARLIGLDTAASNAFPEFATRGATMALSVTKPLRSASVTRAFPPPPAESDNVHECCLSCSPVRLLRHPDPGGPPWSGPRADRAAARLRSRALRPRPGRRRSRQRSTGALGDPATALGIVARMAGGRSEPVHRRVGCSPTGSARRRGHPAATGGGAGARIAAPRRAARPP